MRRLTKNLVPSKTLPSLHSAIQSKLARLSDFDNLDPTFSQERQMSSISPGIIARISSASRRSSAVGEPCFRSDRQAWSICHKTCIASLPSRAASYSPCSSGSWYRIVTTGIADVTRHCARSIGHVLENGKPLPRSHRHLPLCIGACIASGLPRQSCRAHRRAQGQCW